MFQVGYFYQCFPNAGRDMVSTNIFNAIVATHFTFCCFRCFNSFCYCY